MTDKDKCAQKIAEFDRVEIWFVIRSGSAMNQDSHFCVQVDPCDAIEFLKEYCHKPIEIKESVEAER